MDIATHLLPASVLQKMHMCGIEKENDALHVVVPILGFVSKNHKTFDKFVTTAARVRS